MKRAIGARFWLRSITDDVRDVATGSRSGSSSTLTVASIREIASRASGVVSVMAPASPEYRNTARGGDAAALVSAYATSVCDGHPVPGQSVVAGSAGGSAVVHVCSCIHRT